MTSSRWICRTNWLSISGVIVTRQSRVEGKVLFKNLGTHRRQAHFDAPAMIAVTDFIFRKFVFHRPQGPQIDITVLGWILAYTVQQVQVLNVLQLLDGFSNLSKRRPSGRQVNGLHLVGSRVDMLQQVGVDNAAGGQLEGAETHLVDQKNR